MGRAIKTQGISHCICGKIKHYIGQEQHLRDTKEEAQVCASTGMELSVSWIKLKHSEQLTMGKKISFVRESAPAQESGDTQTPNS